MKRIQAVVLLGLNAELLSGSGGRRKLRDLDLSKFTNLQTGVVAQVWGIRFSPDDTKVAIGFGSRWNLTLSLAAWLLSRSINLKPHFANMN